MIGGMLGAMGSGPGRITGIIARRGRHLNVPWVSIRPIASTISDAGSGAGCSETFVLEVAPGGALVAGYPPNGMGSRNYARQTYHAGFNNRGGCAVDLCLFRDANSQPSAVASGFGSGLFAGGANTASGQYAACLGGSFGVASGTAAICVGGGTASGAGSVTFPNSIASGAYSFGFGYAPSQGAHRVNMGAKCGYARMSGTTAYGTMAGSFNMHGSTNSNTPVELLLFNGGTAGSSRANVLNGYATTFTFNFLAVRSDGVQTVRFKRTATFVNLANATTLHGAVITEGTDLDESSGSSVAITADDANDSAKVMWTAPNSEQWRIYVDVTTQEIPYGAY